MRFIFRPLVGYAIHTRKWCRDIALGISRTGVIRRIIDGFLVQVSKLNDAAVADVIDMPGTIFVAGLQSHWSEVSGGVETFYPQARCGYTLSSSEGEPYSGNMTYALMMSEGVAYSGFFDIGWLQPTKYLSASGKPWAPFSCWNMSSLPGSGSSLTYAMAGADGVNQFTDLYVARVAPAPQLGDGAWSLAGDAPPAETASWRVLHISRTDIASDPGEFPLSDFPDVAATGYGNDVVYLVTCSINNQPGSGSGTPAWNASRNGLSVARVQIVDEEDGPQAKVVKLGRITADDLLPQDRPQRVMWSMAPPRAYALVRLNGDYNINSPRSGVFNPSASLDYGPFASFGAFQNPGEPKTRFVWRRAPRLACVGLAEGVDILFTVQTSRELPLVQATWSYSTPELVTVEVDIAVPEYSASGDISLNHTATYLVHVALDGSKTVRCIHRHTFSVHDQTLRALPRVEFSPVLTYRDLVVEGDEVVEVSRFVCIRAESGEYAVGNSDPNLRRVHRAVAPTKDGVDLAVISSDGGYVIAALGDLYPVSYPCVADGISDVSSDTVDGDVRRHGYGCDKFLWPEYRNGYSSVAPACVYAPGMIAVVVAPRAGFASASQIAKLAVIRVRDGELVQLSDFELPFMVSNATGDADQWNVTCVEEGAVDEDGELTRYAKLLLSKVGRRVPSILYRADDLSALRSVGAWGLIGQNYLRGPAYYLGSPIAPAKAGRTTGRSFLAGKAVDSP